MLENDSCDVGASPFHAVQSETQQSDAAENSEHWSRLTDDCAHSLDACFHLVCVALFRRTKKCPAFTLMSGKLLLTSAVKLKWNEANAAFSKSHTFFFFPPHSGRLKGHMSDCASDLFCECCLALEVKMILFIYSPFIFFFFFLSMFSKMSIRFDDGCRSCCEAKGGNHASLTVTSR